LSYGPACGS